MQFTFEKNFLNKIEKVLLGEQEEILKTLTREQDIIESIQADEAPKDSADLASDDTDKNILQALSAVDMVRLEQIQSAIKRLKNGNYGACVLCGNMINPVRLEALPSAHLCIECQRQKEKK